MSMMSGSVLVSVWLNILLRARFGLLIQFSAAVLVSFWLNVCLRTHGFRYQHNLAPRYSCRFGSTYFCVHTVCVTNRIQSSGAPTILAQHMSACTRIELPIQFSAAVLVSITLSGCLRTHGFSYQYNLAQRYSCRFGSADVYVHTVCVTNTIQRSVTRVDLALRMSAYTRFLSYQYNLAQRYSCRFGSADVCVHTVCVTNRIQLSATLVDLAQRMSAFTRFQLPIQFGAALLVSIWLSGCLRTHGLSYK